MRNNITFWKTFFISSLNQQISIWLFALQLRDPGDEDSDITPELLVNGANDGERGGAFVQVNVAVPLLEDLEELFAASGLLGRLQQEVSSHRDGDGEAWQEGHRELEREQNHL